ncbi:hypothetical protein PUN28_008106 [Cardiocondyla obscurior]|uniref:Uncharacterized protein n=1 Tax=Cardiocondyla obscurior TaxID=286306 RepID=A0AAW2G130_9HYME
MKIIPRVAKAPRSGGGKEKKEKREEKGTVRSRRPPPRERKEREKRERERKRKRERERERETGEKGKVRARQAGQWPRSEQRGGGHAQAVRLGRPRYSAGSFGRPAEVLAKHVQFTGE